MGVPQVSPVASMARGGRVATRPTPTKLVALALLWPALAVLREYCLPMMILGGALPQAGVVSGGSFFRCGAFSHWLWNNPTAMQGYLNLRGLRLLFLAALAIVVWSLGYELIRLYRGLPEKPRRFTWGWAVLTILLVYAAVMLFFSTGFGLGV